MHKNRQQNFSKYIDELRHKNKSLSILQSQTHTGQTFLRKVSVNSMWLPETAPRYAGRVAHKVHHATKSGQWYFVTLTQKWERRDLQEKVRYAKRTLQNTIKLARIQHPQARYFYVIEYTKRLQPHFHLLVNSLDFAKEIVTIWQQKTETTQNQIDPIKRKQAKNYVLKYILKFHTLDEKMQEIIFHTIARLYSASRNFQVHEKEYPSCPIWDTWGLVREQPDQHGIYFLDWLLQDFKATEWTLELQQQIKQKRHIHITDISIKKIQREAKKQGLSLG